MVFAAAAPAGFNYETTRSWDYLGPSGNCTPTYINTGPGAFTWTNFDSFFSNNVGKRIVFTLGDTPDYLVSRAATGGSSHTTKSNMVPDDLATWATVVQAIVSRAKNLWGRTGLTWELWNELHQTAFFNDSLALTGPYTKATVEAIRSIDPTANIISPSIGNGADTYGSFFTGWANASDGVGGLASRWVQGLSYHNYYGSTYKATDVVRDWNLFQALQKSVGLNLPVWITESGYATSDPQQATSYIRNMMIVAALGAKCYIGFEADPGFTFSFDTISAKWNSAAALLQGGAVISSLAVGPYAIEIVINGTKYIF